MDLTLSADCFTKHLGFRDQLLVATLAPFVLCAVVWIVSLCVRYAISLSHHESDRRARNKLTADVILFIIFLSYTSASMMIFRGLRPCKELAEEYRGSRFYMRDDYSTSCRSKKHNFIRAWSWIFLFIYPIGIPLLTFAFMIRHRETLNPNVTVDDHLITKDMRGLGRARIDRPASRDLQATPRTRLQATADNLSASVLGLAGKTEDQARWESLQRQVVIAKKDARNKIVDEINEKHDKEFKENGGAIKFTRRCAMLAENPELLAYMYGNYEPEYWWFECFDYIRRLLLTGILTLFEEGTAAQAIFGVLVALAGTQIYAWTSPFVNARGDLQATVTQWATFFDFLAALLILLDVSAKGAINGFYDALLIFVTLVPAVVGAGVLIFPQDDPADQLSVVALKSSGEKTVYRVRALHALPDGDGSSELHLSSEAAHDSSPTSPLARGAPPQEDEEAPAAPAQN